MSEKQKATEQSVHILLGTLDALEGTDSELLKPLADQLKEATDKCSALWYLSKKERAA